MPKLSDQISRPRRGAPLHQVAALPWREGVAGAEVLLVSEGPGGGFAIPTGWPKRNRTDAEAAALEAADEAGAVGTVAPEPVGKISYFKELSAGRVRVEADVYTMRVRRLRARWKRDGVLQRRWVPAGEAAEMVDDAQLAALIGAL